MPFSHFPCKACNAQSQYRRDDRADALPQAEAITHTEGVTPEKSLQGICLSSRKHLPSPTCSEFT
jgi:hypothetical protein